MGIASVAVYSDADVRSPHVALVEEVVRIGPPPAAESCLLGDAILRGARETGAQAVHPGYGCPSERERFARRLADNGIAFIGPPPGAVILVLEQGAVPPAALHGRRDGRVSGGRAAC